ncbi:hypothetical protein RIF29_22197 [Crotalaria pallida]|uniref:Uncharacterized protein n=1 Tax=Crotalaria pallida TaxID=3830 RepID=A0AAN9IA62_CROPI
MAELESIPLYSFAASSSFILKPWFHWVSLQSAPVGLIVAGLPCRRAILPPLLASLFLSLSLPRSLLPLGDELATAFNRAATQPKTIITARSFSLGLLRRSRLSPSPLNPTIAPSSPSLSSLPGPFSSHSRFGRSSLYLLLGSCFASDRNLKILRAGVLHNIEKDQDDSLESPLSTRASRRLSPLHDVTCANNGTVSSHTASLEKDVSHIWM